MSWNKAKGEEENAGWGDVRFTRTRARSGLRVIAVVTGIRGGRSVGMPVRRAGQTNSWVRKGKWFVLDGECCCCSNLLHPALPRLSAYTDRGVGALPLAL